jgi:hypothetical protein
MDVDRPKDVDKGKAESSRGYELPWVSPGAAIACRWFQLAIDPMIK